MYYCQYVLRPAITYICTRTIPKHCSGVRERLFGVRSVRCSAFRTFGLLFGLFCFARRLFCFVRRCVLFGRQRDVFCSGVLFGDFSTLSSSSNIDKMRKTTFRRIKTNVRGKFESDSDSNFPRDVCLNYSKRVFSHLSTFVIVESRQNAKHHF